MTISWRRAAATLAGKAALQLSRRLGAGGGTQLPGVVARRLAPDVLHDLAAALPDGVVLVTGTNGKTTTARMIAAVLRARGKRVLHNRAGANLITGLTATAVAGSDLLGRPRAEIGLFETDEAHLPAAIRETQPRVVLILNLFRDQLDRYGEVDTIAKRWRVALDTLPPSSTVVLNADDPAVAYLGDGLRCKVIYYGLQDGRHGSPDVQHMADSQFCRRCGTAYRYDTVFYGHVGHYHCPNCRLTRPTPGVRLERLTLSGIAGSQLTILDPEGGFDIKLPVPGLYNAINALAAAATMLALSIAPATIRNALESFTAAFGRIERIPIAGRDVLMALIKNPVGASETVRMIAGAEEPRTENQEPSKETREQESKGTNEPEIEVLSPHASRLTPLYLLVVINDKIADGTDVSWLWDANFEQLGGRVAHVVVSGTRAADMAVRLKYAGVDPAAIETVPQLNAALDRVLAASPVDQPLYLLPTYTAMLELREELVRRGLVKPFWED
jgi:lipid II isoglutaminyl synthase (glutamine-hydrolysing)